MGHKGDLTINSRVPVSLNPKFIKIKCILFYSYPSVPVIRN
ncbi:hypothetical protein JN06_02497 [Bacteroides zoogleoformans]|nr:hypothetical protein JN06_02497 [Bacteroides zoogleoformans]